MPLFPTATPGVVYMIPNTKTNIQQQTSTIQTAIESQGIEMVFYAGSQPTRVLEDINLQITKGEIHLLMGPSGSGKTTLLSILAGLLTPTGGSVSLLGTEITQLSSKELSRFRLEKIGFIFQGFNLFSALTARENVQLALNLKGIKKQEARRQAMHLLEQVGLADKADQQPKDLSGGQKQRVAIARALAGYPPIIMADEPTAALDSVSGHAIIDLLRRLAKEEGATVLIVTHDPRILDVADRVICVEDGKLQPQGHCTNS